MTKNIKYEFEYTIEELDKMSTWDLLEKTEWE